MINKWNRQALALALWLIAPLSAVSAAEVASSSAAPVQPVPSPVPADYVIGPGDTLQIFVWRNPELTVSVPVRPDGKISSPLVQDMVAVGKTPSSPSHDIEAVLGEFVRSPQVNVIVTTPAGLMSQVKVVGQIRSPQAYPYREGMRVLDLVLAAGGLTDYAAGNRAKIVRSEGGKSVELRVKLGNLVNKGDMKQNLPLRPGDLLVVPESRL
ncbi:MAG: polysaccharide biosynthesis/export family protein [Proteobacteria bacterium]|nr:polysaccharide biosynthesis/export family protein [Pseudomonadota bacterium]